MTESLVDQINAVRRSVADAKLPSGDAYSVVLTRTYAADPEDVWDAVTSPERLSRWFLPVTGDLKLGGRFQLEGNAHGEIVRCERPRLLTVTWVFGDDPASEVEVRLTPRGEHTEFELAHKCPAGEFWDQYGPGATGVGWDLALFAFTRFLAGEPITDPQQWAVSPEAAELTAGSIRLWGTAHRESGADQQKVAAAVAATESAYLPQESPEG